MAWNRLTIWAIAALVAGLLGAAAQTLPWSTPKRAPPPAPKSGSEAPPPAKADDGPSATTATYGDWVVRCTQQGPARNCEATQTIYVQGQQQPIALIALGREKPEEPLRLVLQVPLNVTVSARAKLELKDGSPIELPFERCVPAGCFAIVQAADDPLRRLRAQTDPGRITFKDASDKEVGFQFSVRGVGSALDALSKSK